MVFRDRTITVALFALALFVYGFFFQGDGYSFQSNWLTTRMLVERGTFEITDYHIRTGDVAIYHDHVYSNKPPGLPLAGVAPYWLLNHIETARGLDPNGFNREWTNGRTVTFLTCGVPGAALVAMMFIALRRRHASQALAAAMSIAFAFGSLLLPFSGMLYNHLLVTACFFGAWLILRSPDCRPWHLYLASFLLGWACISEYMIGGPALAMIAFDLFDRRNVRRAIILCIGPALAVAGMLCYQHALFGNAFSPSYAYEPRDDIVPGDAYSHRFALPDIRRLYWITFHRLRGLFYCCPVFAVAFLSLVKRKSWSISREDGFGLFVIGWFVLFLMTYRYWTGGSGIGPRFAIPALPFLFLMALRGFQRHHLIAWSLASLSMLVMLVVTSVEPNYVSNSDGPPMPWDPVGSMWIYFTLGRIARTRRATNWLIDLGFYSSWDLLPIILLISLAMFACWQLRERESPQGFPVLPAR